MLEQRWLMGWMTIEAAVSGVPGALVVCTKYVELT